MTHGQPIRELTFTPRFSDTRSQAQFHGKTLDSSFPFLIFALPAFPFLPCAALDCPYLPTPPFLCPCTLIWCPFISSHLLCQEVLLDSSHSTRGHSRRAAWELVYNHPQSSLQAILTGVYIYTPAPCALCESQECPVPPNGLCCTCLESSLAPSYFLRASFSHWPH